MSDLNSDRLLRFFHDHPERPWHVQDVQKKLEADDRAELKRALDELVDQGQLIRTRRRTYGRPEEMNLVPGRLQVASGGYGSSATAASMLSNIWNRRFNCVVARTSSRKRPSRKPRI